MHWPHKVTQFNFEREGLVGLGRMGAVFGPVVTGYLVTAGIGISTSFQLFVIPLLVVVLMLYYKKPP